MSDCYDKTRERRAELVTEGRALLAKSLWRGRYGPCEEDAGAGFDLLDRALDAIEWLDREPSRLAGQPGHRIDLDEPEIAVPLTGSAGPTMKVGFGPFGGLDVRIE